MQNMMDIKEDELQWLTSFLIKNQVEMVLLTNQSITLQMSFIGRLLKNFVDKKFIHLLETTLRALI